MADLEQIAAEATAEQTVEEFIDNFTHSVAGLVSDNPLHYRSYGPYWWQVKKALLDAQRGVFDDDYIDREWLDATVYNCPEYALFAAWAYSETRHEEGAQMDSLHIIQTLDGELVEYVLVDEGLERQGFHKS